MYLVNRQKSWRFFCEIGSKEENPWFILKKKGLVVEK